MQTYTAIVLSLFLTLISLQASAKNPSYVFIGGQYQSIQSDNLHSDYESAVGPQLGALISLTSNFGLGFALSRAKHGERNSFDLSTNSLEFHFNVSNANAYSSSAYLGLGKISVDDNHEDAYIFGYRSALKNGFYFDFSLKKMQNYDDSVTSLGFGYSFFLR